jgi:MFS family permease
VAFSSLRPLGSRNFALVWSSALISNVGSWIQTVALGTLVTTTTHNTLWTALVLAAGFLPMGVLAPIGGVLADRLDRRRWLIATTIMEAAFATVLALMVGYHEDPSWSLVLLSFFGGAAGALGFPAYQAMLPDLVERDDLLAAISLSSAQWNMGRILGPAMAGLILVLWSPAVAFSINAVSFAAVIIALLFVTLPTRERVLTGESTLERLRDGARIAAREPGCRSAIILIGIVGFLGSPFIGLIPALAINGLHEKVGGPAILTTAQGIGAVLGALAIAPLAKRRGQHVVVIGSLFGFCVAIVLYGASPLMVLSALCLCLVGAMYIGILSGLNGVVQMRAPEASRARVLSLYMMALGTLYPLGLIVEGAVGQLIGVRLVTVLSGLVLAAILGTLAVIRPALFTALRVRRSDRLLDVATPEVREIDLGGADLERR